MIKLNKVCFSYDGEHPVLVDFCMEIPDGGAIAVMGASGSGKTTLLRILLGSGGMCRRVALARAIAFARSGLGRDAAILDEPLKGLDNAMKKRIVPRFIDAFATRVIITHDENEAELFECGTIIRLNRI